MIRTFKHRDPRRVTACRFDLDLIKEAVEFTGGSILVLPDLSCELSVGGGVYPLGEREWIVKEDDRFRVMSGPQVEERFE